MIILRGRRVGAAAVAVLAMLAVTAADCQVTGRPDAAPSDSESASPSAKSKSKGGRDGKTKPGEVSVPIEVQTMQGETMVLVPVKVNGRGPYDFVLDTGASSSTVSRSLVRRLRLPRTGDTAHVRGVAGATVVPLVAVSRWTVGGQRLHGRSLPVIDLGGDFGSGRVNGLLGSDELRRFGAVKLDYKNERLILRAS
ncbi:MAG TPA: retropepsin-like aspartic protease [Streptosporangiaceae bacterium]|nr:retropepsin-like aspartic protease [Streptosporangiaceae bacterium]